MNKQKKKKKKKKLARARIDFRKKNYEKQSFFFFWPYKCLKQ